MWGVMLRFSVLFFIIASPIAAVRIVSLDVCADQWVLWLFKPDAIAGVSYISKDASLSFYADRAQLHPSHHGAMEEILALHPDIVIAEGPIPARKKKLFQKLAIPFIELSPITTFEDMQKRQQWFQEHFPGHLRDDILDWQPMGDTIPTPQKYVYMETYGHLRPSDNFLHRVFKRMGLEDAMDTPQKAYLHPEELALVEADLMITKEGNRYATPSNRTRYTCLAATTTTLCAVPPAIQKLCETLHHCVRRHVH